MCILLIGLCLALLSIKSKSHHYFFSYLFICTAGISEYKDKSRGLLRVIDNISTMGPKFFLMYLKLLFENNFLKHLLYQAWLRVLFKIWLFVSKGQLISKADMKVFIWTKNSTKIFLYFCPSLKNESIKKNNGTLSCQLVVIYHLI